MLQDRTPEDCLLKGSPEHIRGYFFQYYPKLVDLEISRRHESRIVKSTLEKVGFAKIKEITFWETRKVYANVQELSQDLLARTGRSILHGLTDEELEALVHSIVLQLGDLEGKLIEKDSWTIWIAT